MNKPLNGFITYSHEDTEAKDELRKRLAVMEQQNELVTWDDGQLTPGDKALQEDILKKVADSDLLLYLVSAASLASKNCNRELAEAIKGDKRVSPIILEHCDWLKHKVSNFEVLPHKGKPISKWNDRSEGWQNVVNGIRKAVHKMQSQANSTHKTSGESNLADRVFQRGNFLLMLGQMDMAIEAYSESIQIKPDFATAYNNRGVVYYEKSEYDRAIGDFNKAIEYKSGYAIAYNNRGNAYDDKGEHDRAIEDFTVAIQHKPDFAEAYSNRGSAHINKGEHDRAIEDFTVAIQHKPNFAEAYYNQGNAYRFKGDFDRAIADYTKAIKFNNNYAIAYCNRGNVYFKKGDVNKAIENYCKAVELNPELAEAHNNHGYAYLHKKDFKTAIESFTKAVQLKSDYAQAYGNRALAYHCVGAVELTIADLNEFIQLQPNDAMAYYIRAKTRLTIEEWENAKTDLITAKNIGLDIIALFHQEFESIANFEQSKNIQLPADIAALLTPP